MYNRLIVTNWRLKSVGLVQNDLTSSLEQLKSAKSIFVWSFPESTIQWFHMDEAKKQRAKKNLKLKRFFSIMTANGKKHGRREIIPEVRINYDAKNLIHVLISFQFLPDLFLFFLLFTFISASKIPFHRIRQRIE